MHTGLGVAPAKDKTMHFAELILDLAEIAIREAYAAKKEVPGNLEAIRDVTLRLLLLYPENAKEIKEASAKICELLKGGTKRGQPGNK